MKVVCFSGAAQSGKDTAAHYMKKKLELKGNKVLLTHYADLLKYVCKNFLGWNGRKDEEGRTLLQKVGTDIGRGYDRDFWVNFIYDILSMFPDEWDYVLIADCRFPNEIDILSAKFETYSVKIVRGKTWDSGLTKEQKNHESENALNDYEFDYYILNSDMGKFYVAINNLIREIDEETKHEFDKYRNFGNEKGGE